MPVYAGRVPALAVERLKDIKTSGVKCVIVAVYGNRAYEDALVEMQDVAVGELLLKRHTNPLSQINNEIRLEAYTEQSESNPGRSLGIYNHEEKSCLEDSTNRQPTTDNQKFIIVH